MRRIEDTLGTVPVGKLKVEQVIAWQGSLLETLAPKTVGHHRQTLAQVLDQAVELGLIPTNVVRRVKAPKVPATNARSLSITETRALVDAARTDRYGAAVALLFFQGWRVSEALGLAWEDVDLDTGMARVQRACVYVNHQGARLGPTKTAGVMGTHQLVPTVVDLLRARRVTQNTERLASAEPVARTHLRGSGRAPVFTTPDGRLVLRQSVTKSLTRAAETAGIATEGTRHPHRPPLRRHRALRRGRRIHRGDRPVHRPRLPCHHRRLRPRPRHPPRRLRRPRRPTPRPRRHEPGMSGFAHVGLAERFSAIQGLSSPGRLVVLDA